MSSEDEVGEQFREGVVMTWGEKLQTAIEQRNPTVLRRMAEEARREETQIFLRLVADLMRQKPNRRTPLRKTA